MDLAHEALQWSNHGLAVFMLVALHGVRFYAAMVVLPPFTGEPLNYISPALAALFGIYAGMGQSAVGLAEMTAVTWVLVLVKEIVLGLCIGYATATIFWVAEAVGALFDNAAGFNSIQQQNPMSEEQCTPVSNLLSQTMIALFFMAGGVQAFVSLVLQSFQWWPMPSSHPDPAMLLNALVIRSSGEFWTSMVRCGISFVILLALVELLTGLLARVAPSLDASSWSQPTKAAVLLAGLSTAVVVSRQEMQFWAALGDACGHWRVWLSDPGLPCPDAGSTR